VFDIRNTSIDFTVDVFNLTNSATTTSMYDRINDKFPITGDSAFGLSRRIEEPRQIRLAIRFVF
ncbi:MAG TPA: hypothetical protein QGE93_04900, partial [Acidobacteriota bacterium]|jgi:hypothetical protein|nr:hypothetical protein [Acidobacteriota bacterium]